MTHPVPTADVPADRPGLHLQLVTFTLGEETYGIDITAVREIRGWTETTHLPNTPSHVMGVINLRGLIVPVLDLRERFHRRRTTPTPTHVVIVVARADQTLGLLVDAVSDIVTLGGDDLHSVPGGVGDAQAFIEGLVTVTGKMVAVIDAGHLFSAAA